MTFKIDLVINNTKNIGPIYPNNASSNVNHIYLMTVRSQVNVILKGCPLTSLIEFCGEIMSII